MRSSRSDHGDGDPRAEVAARRLAQLAADLAAGARPTADPAAPTDPGAARTAQPAPSGELEGPHWWDDHTRVARASSDATDPAPVRRGTAGPAAAPAVAAPPAPPASTVPALPVPGRHAARRRRSALPVPRPPGPGWSATHLAVVAVVLATAVLGAAWWVTRDRPAQVAPVAVTGAETPMVPLEASSAPASPGASAGTTGGAEGGEGGEGEVTVDVTGKVRRPGIVVLDAGARVVDAVEAAGGARPGADLSTINLARLLVDGEQVVVGAPAGAAPAPGATPAAPGATAAGTLVNLNLASVTELEELPEVGPVTAAAIVAWRDEHGGFTSVEELLEVSGIGDKTLEMIRPHVTV